MKKGSIWIIGGLLLLAAALGLTAYNYYDQNRAGIRTEAALVQLLPEIEEKLPDKPEKQSIDEMIELPALQEDVPYYILNPNMEMPKRQIDGIDYIGVLSVPDLGLELPVASEWSYEHLKAAPCRFSGSVYLSDMVVCAHNYMNHFGTLRNLTIGAQISFTDMDGNVFKYTVSEMETLQPTEVERMKTGDWDLTLFTCTVGGRTRLAVRCLAVEE